MSLQYCLSNQHFKNVCVLTLYYLLTNMTETYGFFTHISEGNMRLKIFNPFREMYSRLQDKLYSLHNFFFTFLHQRTGPTSFDCFPYT